MMTVANQMVCKQVLYINMLETYTITTEQSGNECKSTLAGESFCMHTAHAVI